MRKSIVTKRILLIFKCWLFICVFNMFFFVQPGFSLGADFFQHANRYVPEHKYQLFSLPVILGAFVFRSIDPNNIASSLINPEPFVQNYNFSKKGDEYEDLSGLEETLGELESWVAKANVDEILDSEQPVILTDNGSQYFEVPILGLTGENGQGGEGATGKSESGGHSSEGEEQPAEEGSFEDEAKEMEGDVRNNRRILMDGVEGTIMDGLQKIIENHKGKKNKDWGTGCVMSYLANHKNELKESISGNVKLTICLYCKKNGLAELSKVVNKKQKLSKDEVIALFSAVIYEIINSEKGRVEVLSAIKEFSNKIIGFSETESRISRLELFASSDIESERQKLCNDDCWIMIFKLLELNDLRNCYNSSWHFRDLINSVPALRNRVAEPKEHEKMKDEKGDWLPMSPIEEGLTPEERQIRCLRGLGAVLSDYSEDEAVRLLYDHCSDDDSKKRIFKILNCIFKSGRFDFDFDFNLILFVKVPELIEASSATSFAEIFFYSREFVYISESGSQMTDRCQAAYGMQHSTIHLSIDPLLFSALEVGGVWSMTYLMGQNLLTLSVSKDHQGHGGELKNKLIDFLNHYLKDNDNHELLSNGTVVNGIFNAREYTALSRVSLPRVNYYYISDEGHMNASASYYQHREAVKEFQERRRKKREQDDDY